jgi:Skp family chaperone for outer membrane proteins
MVASSRGILAIGLSLAGLAYLVVPTLGQAPQQDGLVKKTASPSTGAPPAPVAPVIGTVDIELVFKSYDKVKISNKEYNAALLARKNELMRIMSEAQEEAQMLSKLAPGTEDYKKHENRVTELKARHEAGREQAEREFAQRQAEAMATLYKEIQEMVKRVAQWRKMNYVVRVSNQPITGTDPNSVMAAISSTLVYADTRNDITNDVIFNLNRIYKATAAPAAKPAGAAAMPGQPGAGPTQGTGN